MYIASYWDLVFENISRQRALCSLSIESRLKPKTHNIEISISQIPVA